MPNTINSANMLLPVPIVGVETGPEYANDLNNCLSIIDQHNHAPGSGVQITPNGLNINSDLTIQQNNITNLRSVRYTSQTAPLVLAADVNSTYVSGVDLYYNNSSGTAIRITQNGAVAGTPGSIANLVSPASAAYVSGSSTFVWQSAALTPANLDAASIILRNLSASSFGLTLSPPAAMGSNSTITLPAIPASTQPVSIDVSGNMSAQPITLSQLATALQNALTPAGAILAYGGTSAPAGFLMCDGSAVDRTTYASLFTAIGVAYGSGDGATTFNVPYAYGQFLRGVDHGRGLDPDAGARTASASGGNSGDNVGSFQSSAFQSHAHNYTSPTGAAAFAAGGSGNAPSTSATAVNGGSSETRPVNLYVNYIIKT